ncbi:hypothetical protein ACMDB5_03050 [Flavobacterium sp. W1B]|uniref:hypothetical protein n=1 Tax=Flavobacterium sp. W1B TaxID=3394146 RepID=UPI0039BCB725
MKIITLVQGVDIAEKLKSATDNSYQIGVLIGSFIPFVVLVGLAYWMYASAKKELKTVNYSLNLHSKLDGNEQNQNYKKI